jgi:salicylate hydroxylase
MTVLIVGGGIGGLALARALALQGMEDVLILEQAPAIAAVGAGIQITPNAARVLDHLGLTERLASGAVESQGSVYHDLFSDELILETPAGAAARRRYGHGYFQVHRSALLDVLRESVKADQIRLGSRCVAASQDADGVVVELADGQRVRGDVLIGADGLNSVVRRLVVPDAGPPEFSGVIGCRTVIPAQRAQGLGLDRRQHTWWGPGLRVIAYWVSGGEGLNFLAMVPCDNPDPASWPEAAAPENLRRLFANASPSIKQMVELLDATFATGVFGHAPLERIVDRRAGLIGDAAHPLPPYLANGAAQAMEDAVVLARCLTRSQTAAEPSEALLEYQHRRLPRVTDVQAGSWEMDRLGNVAQPHRLKQRNEMLRGRMEADPEGAWLRDWLWGYDAVSAADSEPVLRPPRPDFDLQTLEK